MLDATHSATQRILDRLRETDIEPSFRPANGKGQCLMDFVDENGVADLTKTIQQTIDRVGELHTGSAAQNGSLNNALKLISTSLHASVEGMSDWDLESIANIFQSLEAAAAEMADLLQSLIKHYDLSAVALKHIEGGGEAAAEADAGVANGVPHRDAISVNPSQPISTEELEEMVQVLEKDALEVDEVVQEIRDHVAGMESNLDYIHDFVTSLEAERAKLLHATKLLLQLESDLPGFVVSSRTSRAEWNEAKQVIEARREDLGAMGVFFDDFVTAYDGLVLEVVRRKRFDTKVKRLIHEATSKITKLCQGESLSKSSWRVTTEISQRKQTPAEHSAKSEVIICHRISGLGCWQNLPALPLSWTRTRLIKQYPILQTMS